MAGVQREVNEENGLRLRVGGERAVEKLQGRHVRVVRIDVVAAVHLAGCQHEAVGQLRRQPAAGAAALRDCRADHLLVRLEGVRRHHGWPVACVRGRGSRPSGGIGARDQERERLALVWRCGGDRDRICVRGLRKVGPLEREIVSAGAADAGEVSRRAVRPAVARRVTAGNLRAQVHAPLGKLVLGNGRRDYHGLVGVQDP